MEQTLIYLLLIFVSYLIGNICTGYILVRLTRGVDIRTIGSGSLGARNVGHLIGGHGFAITLIGDALKGVIVVVIARWFELADYVLLGMAVAVITGHVWPVFLQFRGGKGIATAIGVYAVYDYPLLLVILGFTVLIYMMARNFTKSWVLAMIVLPVFMVFQEYRMHEVIAVLIISALLIYAHRENIKSDIFSPIKEG